MKRFLFNLLGITRRRHRAELEINGAILTSRTLTGDQMDWLTDVVKCALGSNFLGK